ncbi:MAG: hypothetical protein H8E44_20985 [Planctomycetes bacterium]|nr:hypothetical protein [Planctomycetota bacterium]MBL7040394.1 hypothetical protein [Pirellulaceae bacterium]
MRACHHVGSGSRKTSEGTAWHRNSCEFHHGEVAPEYGELGQSAQPRHDTCPVVSPELIANNGDTAVSARRNRGRDQELR